MDLFHSYGEQPLRPRVFYNGFLTFCHHFSLRQRHGYTRLTSVTGPDLCSLANRYYGLSLQVLRAKGSSKQWPPGWNPPLIVGTSSLYQGYSSEILDASPSSLTLAANILTFLCLLLLWSLLLYTTYFLLTVKELSEIRSSPQWTRLPTVCPLGSKKKLTGCSGCLLPVDVDVPVHKCLFLHKGFTINSTSYLPCKVMYHSKCIRVGPPFRSRHYGKGTLGLQYPPCATDLPFICEMCTVRAHLGREIDPLLPSDTTLLLLERMRMIDAAHAWAPSTLKNACTTLRRTNKFFTAYDLPPLHNQLHLPSLSHPPLNVAIPIFWSMEHHTTYPSARSQGAAPSWNSARAQRSALSLYCAWTAAFCFPTNSYKDDDGRVLSAVSVSPSDNILSKFTASGIGSRLGTESRPSQALNALHIHWNQEHRGKLLRSTSSLHVQYDIVAAQCVELLAWLGWLRATEIFLMAMSDVELVPPGKGECYNLPPAVGALLLLLLPSTKSSRNKQVDVVIAWKTASGLYPGYWFTLLFRLLHELQ